MNIKRPARTLRRIITLNTLRHISRTSLRHSQFHRRMQIAIVIERYGKTWKSPVIKKLVEKYGTHEDA